MIGLGVGIEIEGAAKTSAEYAAMATRAENLARPLGLLGLHHVRKAQRILDSGEREIQSRSRGLARSLTYAVAAPELGVGSNAVHAAAQQFGPPGGFFESSRPGGLLAIPIADNIAARGQAKFNSPRDVPEGFFVRTAKYLLFARRRQSKLREPKGRRSKFQRGMAAALLAHREKLEVLFVLKARVAGRAHRYVTHDPADGEAWRRFATDWVVRGK